MKQPALLLLLCINLVSLYGQDFFSINSGAVSTNDIVFSVGEIFVVPASSSDDVSSGLIGVVSSIELVVTGVNEIEAKNNTKIYPNPTTNSFFIETNRQSVNQVFVYSMDGKLIFTKQLVANKVDLLDLPSGIYLIETDNLDVGTFKIIKN